MTAEQKSCAVAIPMQRNNATPSNVATAAATGNSKNSRKPASIRELRAQLKAQQYRNQAETVSAACALKVAHDPSQNQESCAVALPSERNNATQLIHDFMEIDGLSLEDATRLAQDCAYTRPASEWLDMIKELDGLICQFCDRFKLDQVARRRVLDVRNRQSLFTIAHSLKWFRDELAVTGKENREHGQ